MEVGDTVLAIGNAMGEGISATQGIISTKEKTIVVERRTLTVLQTDAAINQGNSGGPLVNANGEVIGINTAKLFASGVEGMGYSLPINEALAILNEILEIATADRPFLGITYREVTEEMKDLFNLPTLGIIIREVHAGTAAEKAGLQERDIVVAFGDYPISGGEDLRDALAASKVGEEVVLGVYRNNEMMEVTVTIGNLNER
jgi:serine protease Do